MLTAKLSEFQKICIEKGDAKAQSARSNLRSYQKTDWQQRVLLQVGLDLDEAEKFYSTGSMQPVGCLFAMMMILLC